MFHIFFIIEKLQVLSDKYLSIIRHFLNESNSRLYARPTILTKNANITSDDQIAYVGPLNNIKMHLEEKTFRSVNVCLIPVL